MKLTESQLRTIIQCEIKSLRETIEERVQLECGEIIEQLTDVIVTRVIESVDPTIPGDVWDEYKVHVSNELHDIVGSLVYELRKRLVNEI